MFNFCVIDWGIPVVLYENTDIDKCYEFIDSHCDEYADLTILFGREDLVVFEDV